MAPQTRKRKQESLLGEATKRLRIEDELPAHDQVTAMSEDDYSDGNFSGNEYDTSEDESSTRRSKTPLTPATRLSTVSPAPTPAPTKAKFPSQLKTIACTYEGCTKTFNRPARLATHLLKHEGKKTFLCTYEGCDKAYFEQKHLTSHIKGSHIQERSYKCDWVGCEKSFLTATRLNRHKDAHQGHERFRCTSFPPCNQTFRKHQTLQRHIRSDHLNESPFPCTHVDPITNEECDSGFDAASKLKRHKEQVHGDVKFFCEECTIPGRTDANGSPMRLGFATNVKLQAHIKSAHANCQFCERKCSSQRELQKHVESQHSGTSLEDRKTIACPYRGCDKKFTKKSNLNSHIKSAHQGLRFICGAFDLSKTRDLSSWNSQDGCEQAFVSKANLEDHVRTAHLELPSLINKNRKKATLDKDEGDLDENYDLPNPPKKRKEVKEPSAMEKLLGLTYDNRRTISCIFPTCAHKFMREYDLQNHIRSKHRLSTPEIENMAGGSGFSEEPFGDPTFAGPVLENTTLGGHLPEINLTQGFADAQQMGSFFDEDDMDWEMQRRALEGGPFWIGGDEAAIEMQSHSGWRQSEAEMTMLVDQTIDPSLR